MVRQWMEILVLAAWGTWMERVVPWILMIKVGSRLEKYSRYSKSWVSNFVPAVVMALWVQSFYGYHLLRHLQWLHIAVASVLTIIVAWWSHSLAASVMSGIFFYWLSSFIR
ncbi:AzlD domain-containing protein [Sulfobacillus thermosulfidooxidans]|uniref:AzlD domain-containing protein n=1 Tax=Sulfobacillus thermosulfidooxidans TaxID=28034 RepID=UPI000A82C1EB|nr:AzlD domain-containing protein [Sulfobacillus thermosulfidooxidans]